MLQSFKHSSWREKAQSMIEFALVFPVLLLLLYGIIEFGRMLFIYTSVTTSSREAARYGSAVGNVGGVPRYLNCAGILSAARRAAILTPVAEENLEITYDHGPNVAWYPSDITCATAQGEKFLLGDRVVVEVTAHYEPLLPLVDFASFDISSRTGRTIIQTVEVLGTPAPSSSKPYIYFEFASQSGTETELDTDEKTIYVVLSNVATSNVTAFFTYAGTATRNQDYTGLDSLIFTPGQKRLALARVTNDPYDEWDETIEITIESANGAIIDEDKDTHTTTILDSDTDDPAPTVQFLYPLQDVFEDQAIFVIATLSEQSGKEVTVPYTYSGEAEYNVDYSLNPAALNFIFPPMSGLNQQIALLATKDGIDEEDIENVYLTLGVPTNATLGAPLTDNIQIKDIDLPPNVSFDLASQKVVEGLTVRVKVVLDTITTKVVTVAFTATDATVNGATKNVDYTVDTASPVTIPAGSLEAEILITIREDVPLPDGTLPVELDEFFDVDMTTATNATPVDPKKHTITIMGIAVQPIVNFEASKSASEADGVVQIRFLLDHVWNKAVTVPYRIIGGSAVNGTDYVAAAGTVTIPIGYLYGTFTVNLIEDSIDEENETIIFIMDPPTNATQGTTTQHVLTIGDNDDAPFVTFELASQIGMENGGPMTARVLLSAPSSKNVIVGFTYNSTATPGTEFTITASPVTILAGSTSANIVITVLDDTIPGEGNEAVNITLGPLTNGQMGAQPTHTATIKDNDICPTLSTRDVQPNSGNNYIVYGMSYPDLTQPTIWITEVYIEWNNGTGQKLMQVDWIGTSIWADKNGTGTAPLNITSFTGPQSNRSYAPSLQERLLVVYFKNPIAGVPDDYNVTVTFNNQCTVP